MAGSAITPGAVPRSVGARAAAGLWRWLGFEFLVNHFPRFRRFWEYYLCYVVRGKVMEFEFEAIK